MAASLFAGVLGGGVIDAALVLSRAPGTPRLEVAALALGLYGTLGLVRIADAADDFVRACEAALRDDRALHLRAVDRFLAGRSWDRTWREMHALVARAKASTELAETSVEDAWSTT